MTVDLKLGDCRDVMAEMPDNAVDSIVTDPPYGLSDHRPEDVVACLSAWIAGEVFTSNRSGFMGKTWDSWVPGPEVWKECLRVLKPGGMMLVFAGTRSMDLMSMAIRLAGFELRDSIGYAHDNGGAPLCAWVYATGFPKSHNISKAIDRMAGAEREVVATVKKTPSAESDNMNDGWKRPWAKDHPHTMDITAPATPEAQLWNGWGTALAPSWEPIILAMKPLDGAFAHNALTHGVAGLNIDGSRIASEGRPHRVIDPKPEANGAVCAGRREAGHGFDGGSKAVGTTDVGRWPKNAILDEEAARLLDEQSGITVSVSRQRNSNVSIGGKGIYGGESTVATGGFSDSGGASRFFYVAKASQSERNLGLDDTEKRNRDASRNAEQPSMNGGEGNPYNRGAKPVANHHPTVKPVKLLEYLCTLTKTPTGGIVLDPFMGSGSTGIAAIRTGRDFIGIELNADYLEIARLRIEHEMSQTRQPTLFGD